MADQIETEPTPQPKSDPALTTAALARAGEPTELKTVVEDEPRAFAPATANATPLFAADEAQGLRGRWDAIQTSFVDEPRQAVEQADSLVATAMKRLAEIFAEERASLDGQWDRGDDVSTEDLRLALQRYRSFFGRLLSI